MPTIEELWMQIEVQGIGELYKATEATDKFAKSQNDLAKAGGSTKQKTQDIYDFADAYEVLGEEMQSVFTSAQKVGQAQAAILNPRTSTGAANEIEKAAGAFSKVDAASGKAKGGVAGFGQTMLQSGRIVQDFAQGGLGGILNNIEGFTQALGLGSGLAGILTIVGVGFMVLKPQIMDFIASLNAGGVKEFVGQLDALNARIKELEEKPHKLTVDMQELQAAKEVVDNIKAAIAEVEKLRKGQQHYEKESGSAIEGMIAESDGGTQGVHQKLRDSMSGGVMAEVVGPIKAEEDRKRADLEEAAHKANVLYDAGDARGAAGYQNTAARLRKEIEQLGEKRLAAADDVMKPGGIVDQRIGATLAEAKTGSGRGQASAQAKLAEMLDKAGLGGLARGVAASSPEQLLANDQADDALEASIDAQKDGAKKRDAAKKKADAAAKKAETDENAREAAARQTPEYKEYIDQRKRRGEMDEFGRQIGDEGFNDRSAAKVMAKANADIKKAPKSHDKLSKVDPAAIARAQAARQREALAEQIHANSGGGYSPDQSRQIAGRAMHLAQKNGDLSGSVMLAVGETQAAMNGMLGRLNQLEAKAAGLKGNANQLNRRAHQRQPSALNSGGPQ